MAPQGAPQKASLMQVVGIEVKRSAYQASVDALRELQELLRQEGHPPLDNVTFYHGEASAVIKEKNLSFSHVYSFDYCINDFEYMGELAEAIENMPFKIFCSSKKKAYWELFEFYVKEIYFDGGFKNDVDFRMSKSKERHRMYFYEKQHLDLSTVHTTLGDLLGTVDRSIALFSPKDRIRFFQQVTMRHLRFTAFGHKVSLEDG